MTIFFALLGAGLLVSCVVRSRKQPDRPLDFGDYGIILLDPITDEFRAMTTDEFTDMEQDANAAVESYWARLEWDAVLKYGRRILENN